MSVGSMMFMMGMEGMMMNKKHMIQMLMGLELMLLGLMMMSMMNGVSLDDMVSSMYTLKMLMMAAVESGVGLTMMVGYYSMSGKMEW